MLTCRVKKAVGKKILKQDSQRLKLTILKINLINFSMRVTALLMSNDQYVWARHSFIILRIFCLSSILKYIVYSCSFLHVCIYVDDACMCYMYYMCGVVCKSPFFWYYYITSCSYRLQFSRNMSINVRKHNSCEIFIYYHWHSAVGCQDLRTFTIAILKRIQLFIRKNLQSFCNPCFMYTNCINLRFIVD